MKRMAEKMIQDTASFASKGEKRVTFSFKDYMSKKEMEMMDNVYRFYCNNDDEINENFEQVFKNSRIHHEWGCDSVTLSWEDSDTSGASDDDTYEEEVVDD